MRAHTKSTHTVSGLGQQSPLVWKAIAGYNNYSLAGLLVVGPLFQQSGFSLPLDLDQVRLHNTPLCLKRERERKGETEKEQTTVQSFSVNTYVLISMCVRACTV